MHLAARRSIIAINGVGEYLPVRSETVGTVYILFTLCFLDDLAAVIRECFRILTHVGRLVLGFVPQHSTRGKRIAELDNNNNPLYRHARLQTVAETVCMLDNNGFDILESWSTLSLPPNRSLQSENPLPGSREEAGLNILVSRKKGEYC